MRLGAETGLGRAVGSVDARTRFNVMRANSSVLLVSHHKTCRTLIKGYGMRHVAPRAPLAAVPGKLYTATFTHAADFPLASHLKYLQRYAEAEKTNGRWAMAAVAGILFTDLLGKTKWFEAGAEVRGGACEGFSWGGKRACVERRAKLGRRCWFLYVGFCAAAT